MSEPAGTPLPSRRAGLRLLYRMTVATDRSALLRCLGLGILASAAASVFPLLFGALVDAALDGRGRAIVVLAVALGLAQAGSMAARSYSSMLSWNLWERMTVVVDELLVAVTTRLGRLDRVQSAEFADRLTLVRTDREQFQQSMAALTAAVMLAVQLLVTVAILVSVAPVLLALPVLSAAPILAAQWGETRTQRARQASAADTREADGLALLAVEQTAAAELRVLRLAGLLATRQQAAWRRAVRTQGLAGLAGDLASIAALTVFTAGFAGAVLLVTVRTAHGDATVGAVVLVLTGGQQLHSQLGRLLSTASALFRVVETGVHLRWLQTYVDRHAQRGERTAPAALRHGIRLRGVSFGYPGSGREVLAELDLDLPAGAVVAVVGDNGAGKSTLISLLLGLHEPDAGSITVDGVDLTELDPAGWRAGLTATFQEFVRYELLAREAVGLGRSAAADDAAAVRGALRRADVADVEDELPAGLDTPLGGAFLDGVDLSGGQWQKLALARSMMRDQPVLLVLDEPTYSLDVESESRVYRWFSRVAGDRPAAGTITLIVSHRFSTVRTADLVVVLHDGRLVETGSHAELLAAGGRYARMYATQAAGYR